MTQTGVNRIQYRAIETPPSRFANPTAYSAWCKRADRWAAER